MFPHSLIIQLSNTTLPSYNINPELYNPKSMRNLSDKLDSFKGQDWYAKGARPISHGVWHSTVGFCKEVAGNSAGATKEYYRADCQWNEVGGRQREMPSQAQWEQERKEKREQESARIDKAYEEAMKAMAKSGRMY